MEEELVQMLAGALTMLSAANCSLVGGHTSEGAEAALGFSVTGVVHPAKALAKGPLPRGSALILTKALGTYYFYPHNFVLRTLGETVSCWALRFCPYT
jgi:selenide,water dikinase